MTDELARAYERINQLEDLANCALAHLEGDPGYASKPTIIAYLQAYFAERKQRRADENDRLRAINKELRAALKIAWQWAPTGENWISDIAKVRTAIKKATGE